MTMLSLPSASPLTLGGNHTLTLGDRRQLYQVKSGSVALFITERIEDRLEGQRHYWFTVEAGDFLWGIDSADHPFGLMAIALENSELLPVSVEALWGTAQQDDLLAGIQRWLDQIGQFLANRIPVYRQTILNVGSVTEPQPFPLAAKSVVQGSNTLLWMRLETGSLCFVGLEDIPLGPNTGLIPLYLQQWFQSLGEGTLIIQSDISSCDPTGVLDGLDAYHALLLNYLDKYYQYENKQEVLKLEQRIEYNQQVIENTLNQLASIVNRQADESLELLQTPLLKAMGKIGRYLGVEIKPPAQSEDLKRLKNPLDGVIRASRLQMRHVLLAGEWWKRDNGPLLAYRNDHIPVALIPERRQTYSLYDPVQETTEQITAKTIESLSSSAFMFYRTFPDRPIGIWDIGKFALYRRYGDIFLIAVCTLSATLLNMINPILIGQLFNTVIPDAETSLLFQMGIILIAATLSVSLFKLTQGFTLLRLETASDAPTQAAVWDRVLQLQARFFRHYSSGDLQSRIMGVTAIRKQLSGSTLSVILSSVFALLNLGLMLYYSFDIALLGLITALVALVVTAFHGFMIVRQNRKLLNLQGEIFGRVVQIINAIPKLRVAGAQERAFAYWAKDFKRQAKLNLDVNITKNSLTLFNQVLSSVVTIILFWFAYGAMRPESPLIIPKLSEGNFMAANAALGTFIGSITSLSNTLVGTLDILNLWERTQPVLSAPLEVDNTKIDPGKLHGKVSVENVTFRYQSDKPPVLKGVSLSINPGDFVALVGATGCGKSTLMRLLLGFETPESGVIYYDDQDLSQLNIQAVRRQLGVVLQTSRLQAASIFDNIAGGALINLEEAWEAAAMAGFDGDIKSMPMGMNTVVSEGGTNLSGGQRQRLLIAKALVLKPKILLFDEATSALDNQTQAIVTQSLDQMNVSRLVIAHRLSTIRSADRIYVLDKGEIVQQGSFEELIKEPGLFAQLAARQMA
ncbi:MAG: NHLP bacteriocin export ABC transporter permease/ATPase subunit [Synechocystis sp.]|nr:NHLP bacteriocin export ABC transporter permease/ATPase subunit [Synechocystis sp.]